MKKSLILLGSIGFTMLISGCNGNMLRSIKIDDIKVYYIYDEEKITFQYEPKDADIKEMQCKILDEDIAQLFVEDDGTMYITGYKEGETSYSCSIGTIRSNTASIIVQDNFFEKKPKPSDKNDVQNNVSTPEPTPAPDIPLEHTNALQAANNYLKLMPFSYTGLIKQLNFEGYTAESATYAADNCGANWNEQATKKAQSYISLMSFSRQGLIDQLLFEGYSQEQAEYGVTSIGY